MSDKERSVHGAQDEDQELEQYGVWVKVGPEDYNESAGTEEDFGLSDFDEEPTLESLDDNITEEEEDLLSSLEESKGGEEGVAENFDDFEFGDEEELPDIPEEELPELSSDEDEVSSEEELTLELDDEAELGFPEDSSTSDESGKRVQPSVDFALDSELDNPEGEEFVATDEAIEDDLSILEPSEEEENEIDLSDIESSETERMVENLPELDLSEEDSNFDDVSAVEEEMTSDAYFDPESTPRSRGGEDSLSILHTIEKELSSIKDELSQLKKELSTLRGAPAAGAPGATGQQPDHEVTGFFEEEEDETIALTGDELDNILNTAEFTEEAGKPTEIDDYIGSIDTSGKEDQASEEPEEVSADLLQSDEDLLRDTELEETLYEEPELPADELPIEEITIEDEAETDIEAESLTESASEPQQEEVDMLAGEESEVDALAQMDIESELAEIEELEDETEEDFEFDSGDLDIDLTIPEKEETAEVETEAETPKPVEEAAEEIEEAQAVEPEEELESFEELEELEEEPADGMDLLEEASEEPEELEVEEAEEAEDWSPDLTSADEDEVEVAEPTAAGAQSSNGSAMSGDLKAEIKTVLRYMDQLLEALPEEKIQEFARSEHFIVYKRLFEELGLEQ